MDMSTPYSPKPLVNATCKLGEKGCFNDGRCHALGDCENKIVTNADKIRAMSDEELADILEGLHSCPPGRAGLPCDLDCRDCWANWCQQPAEVDNGV